MKFILYGKEITLEEAVEFITGLGYDFDYIVESILQFKKEFKAFYNDVNSLDWFGLNIIVA